MTVTSGTVQVAMTRGMVQVVTCMKPMRLAMARELAGTLSPSTVKGLVTL